MSELQASETPSVSLSDLTTDGAACESPRTRSRAKATADDPSAPPVHAAELKRNAFGGSSPALTRR